MHLATPSEKRLVDELSARIHTLFDKHNHA